MHAVRFLGAGPGKYKITDNIEKGNIVEKLIDPRKAFGIVDGFYQTVAQLLITFVRRQIQAIETGVCPWVIVRVPPFLDGKGLRPVGPVQLFEAIHWYPRSTRDKL